MLFNPQRREKSGAHEEAGTVDREDGARPCDGDDHSRERRPENVGRALREREERIRLLQARSAHSLRYERGRGRGKEPSRRACERLQGRELPNLGEVSEEERRGDGLGAEADEVCRDHHGASRQPIRPHAANDDERRSADREGGEHDP